VFIRLFLIIALLLLAAPAAAQVRVLCYGDSLTLGGGAANPEYSYPSELQRLRPDLEVRNAGRVGDCSGDLDRFRAALAESQPDIVVLMLGTDDAVCASSATSGCEQACVPGRSAENVLTMAALAYNAGAKVFVLTPPPAVCNADCLARNDANAAWLRDAVTGKLANELRRVRTPHGIRIADLRSRLSDTAWSTLSTDGVHPSVEGNRMIARFVAAYIGHSPTVRIAKKHRTASAREAKRTDEPSPFARNPQDRRYVR
jgi:lysophospholipase L1-like esterase